MEQVETAIGKDEGTSGSDQLPRQSRQGGRGGELWNGIGGDVGHDDKKAAKASEKKRFFR